PARFTVDVRCFSLLILFLPLLPAPLFLPFSPFFFYCYPAHRDLHSFPTRRSSDLSWSSAPVPATFLRISSKRRSSGSCWWSRRPDRKSTRLNSSHLGISYAVFCLKKKKKKCASRTKNTPIKQAISDRRCRIIYTIC